MSFEEQERALFDLLFDRSLRENFCQDSTSALAAYKLNGSELNDFREIRSDAIELDASMRTYLILTHICRQFPITFSLVSSLQNGKNMLKELINLQTMRCHPTERATVFATQLRQQMPTCKFDSDKEQTMITAILEAELGMAWTSAALKRQVLEGESSTETVGQQCADWLDKPVKLAAYVSAAVIPQSYQKLKTSLCPCEDTNLWAHLSKTPLPASIRRKTLADEDPKLFITRAYISKMSRCDPTVNHQTAELAEGFAPLFQHLNSSSSIGHILEQLKQTGASQQILEGVQTGFQQLLTSAMLEFA